MESIITSNAPRIPSGLAALVQRRAVLEPLVGSVEGDEHIVEATRQVAELWRDRVMALARAGLPELANPTTPKGGRAVSRTALAKAAERRDRAVNCPTPFIVAEPRGRACGLHSICPHCWARLVERLWRGIDKAFFQPLEHKQWERHKSDRTHPHDPFWIKSPVNTGVPALPLPVRPKGPARSPRSERFDLIEWVTTFDAPQRLVHPASQRAYETVGEVIDQVTDEGRKNVLYRRGGLLGALDAPTIVPKGDDWHAEIRRLLMIPTGSGPLPSWQPLLAEGEVRVLSTPTRVEVLEAVVRACSCPAVLLAGADPGRVVALLNARRGRSVRVAYSRFGNRGGSVRG